MVTATGTKPPVAKYTRVPRPAMPPITIEWGRMKTQNPIAYRMSPTVIMAKSLTLDLRLL